MLTKSEREELVIQHMELAQRIAKRRKQTIPSCVQLDELISAAYYGLVDAAQRYNPVYQFFAPYASVRISGAIGDFLRERGWGKRNYTKQMKNLSDVQGQNEEFKLEPMEESLNNGGSEEFFNKVTAQLGSLPQKILKLYYINGCTMKEIAAEINLSEGRVSQLVSQSRKTLRNNWVNREYELWEEAC